MHTVKHICWMFDTVSNNRIKSKKMLIRQFELISNVTVLYKMEIPLTELLEYCITKQYCTKTA